LEQQVADLTAHRDAVAKLLMSVQADATRKQLDLEAMRVRTVELQAMVDALTVNASHHAAAASTAAASAVMQPGGPTTAHPLASSSVTLFFFFIPNIFVASLSCLTLSSRTVENSSMRACSQVLVSFIALFCRAF
jgi:hypothetical protein